MPSLPQNSLIAVTGVTGYIASHLGLIALRSGYRVRGTVRSIARGKDLKHAYEKQSIPAAELDERLEFVVVEDLSSEEQWLRALDGVDGVAHVALQLHNFASSEIITDAIDGTVSLLRAAKKIPSVKRVVVTSSSAAVISPPIHTDRALTDEDWNDVAVEYAEGKVPIDEKDPIVKRASVFFFYAAAKVKAEKAAWEFVKNEQPQFDLVSIVPDTNWGPVLHGSPPSTAGWIASVMKNDPTWTRQLPSQWFVDARDVAKLHFLGLTTPSMGGKRFLAAAEPWGWNAVFAILRKHFPGVQVPEDFAEGVLDTQKIDNGPATQVLGGWIGLEQSLVDLAKSLGY